MYKTLSLAALLLLPMFALTQEAKTHSTTKNPFTPPLIVAKASLKNQTAPIPTTTMFTPVKDGLFRVSSYMAMTTPNPNGGSTAWLMNIFFTDEAGGEQFNLGYLSDSSQPPFAWGLSGGYNQAAPFVFRAVAGTPVTYSVTGPAGGTYELFFVVERLD